MINQEEIYRAIQVNNWDYLIDVLYKNRTDISTDVLLKQAADIFVKEFIKKINSNALNKTNALKWLEELWLLHKGNFYTLEKADYKIVVCKIVENNQENAKVAYNYAKEFPNEEICKKIIAQYENEKPRQIIHSQSEKIFVTENKEIKEVDYRINLFKSKQEEEFFLALKKVYDSYQIYPNVAISCLLDFDLLKNELSQQEKDYFFKGIVDFVIFDQVENYYPIHFFELDSIFHDDEIVKNRDKLKDSIFAKAGVSIRRIRKQDKHVSIDEFVKLIRELKK